MRVEEGKLEKDRARLSIDPHVLLERVEVVCQVGLIGRAQKLVHISATVISGISAHVWVGVVHAAVLVAEGFEYV